MNENQLYTVGALVVDDPYSDQISEFFRREFPGAKTHGIEPTLEMLSKIFLGTSQVRYGPLPTPESQVAVRAVLRHRIECNEPIPILVPWGGRKTVPSRSVDVAEVSALKQLDCLRRQVELHYTPGIKINIRLEDTGAWLLYPTDDPEAVTRYSTDFQKLVRILNLGYINPIRESSLMDTTEYIRLSTEVADAVYDYLVETDAVGYSGDSKTWIKLQNLGWQGRIPKVQREYYRARYRAHEPGITDAEATRKLATYFGGSLARYRLNGSAVDEEWKHGGYVQISFIPPVPGAPSNMVSRTLYYRTAPERMSRTHIAPWRALGYLRIGNDQVMAKITGFHEEITNLTSHMTRLSRSGEDLDVQTDYVVLD